MLYESPITEFITIKNATGSFPSRLGVKEQAQLGWSAKRSILFPCD